MSLAGALLGDRPRDARRHPGTWPSGPALGDGRRHRHRRWPGRRVDPRRRAATARCGGGPGPRRRA